MVVSSAYPPLSMVHFWLHVFLWFWYDYRFMAQRSTA